MCVRTVIGAAAWASYLINDDASGLSDEEQAACDAWYEREIERCEYITDAGEAYFSWMYDMHTGTPYKGGDVAEYTVIRGLME